MGVRIETESLSAFNRNIHSVFRHPDFDFSPSDSYSVQIYNQMIPSQEFIIIGRIEVDATLAGSAKQVDEKMREEAAKIGGDGVIITREEVDIYAFNLGTKTQGSATVWGNTITYSQTSTPNMMYIKEQILYGYIIKAKGDTRPSGLFDLLGKRTKGKVTIVNRSLNQVEVNITSRTLVLTGLKASGLIWPSVGGPKVSDLIWPSVGMDVDIIYFDRNDVRLFFNHDGSQKELRLRIVK